MNIKTRGIVFHHIKYSDTSLIATIFTESSGRKSFLIKGVYKPKALIKPSFFQPLNLLQLEISFSGKRDLQRLKDVSPSPVLNSLFSDVYKQSLVFFIAEVLYKTVKEEEPNSPLFEFIYNSVLYLDASDGDISNFHLVFLIQLSRFLGFFPLDNYSDKTPLFDTLNGIFIPEIQNNEYCFSKRLSYKFQELLNLNFEGSTNLALNRTERVELLELLISYYGIHLHSHLKIQSLQILKELFD